MNDGSAMRLQQEVWDRHWAQSERVRELEGRLRRLENIEALQASVSEDAIDPHERDDLGGHGRKV